MFVKENFRSSNFFPPLAVSNRVVLHRPGVTDLLSHTVAFGLAFAVSHPEFCETRSLIPNRVFYFTSGSYNHVLIVGFEGGKTSHCIERLKKNYLGFQKKYCFRCNFNFI